MKSLIAFLLCMLCFSAYADIRSGSNMKITGSDGTTVGVDTNGQMHTVMMGRIDSNNSSTTPLSGGSGFTGSATDASGYSTIAVTVNANVTSSYRGLKIQFSPDLSHWHDGETYTIPANTDKFYSVPVWSRYYRLLYTNGTAAQASFDLEAYMRKAPTKYSSHNIIDDLNDQDDAELMLSVTKAKNPSGNYVNIGATSSGNLKVANVEDGLSIAKGDVAGHSTVHKYGFAPDWDQDSGEVTIWDGTEDNTNWENNRYNWSTTADIRGISSSDNTDTQLIEVQGLGPDTNMLTQTVTLSGTNIVTFATNFFRVFRAFNANSAACAGHIVVYTNNTAVNITAGIPTDKEGIRLIIHPEAQQTEMALYTVPLNKTAYMRSFYASVAGASKTADFIIRLYARAPGGVFRLKHRFALIDGNEVPIQHEYKEPVKFVGGTDIELTVEIPEGTADAASIAGGFDLVLVDN